MASGRVSGKVAVVTGGARGQGEAHVRLLLAEGAKVVFTDVLEAEGEALARELGEGVRFVRHDVTDLAGWENVIRTAEALFGPVTVLVNNAGITSATLLAQLSEAEYRRIIDVNQLGTFLGMKAVLPSMRRAGGGSIVNVSSAAGMNAVPSIPYTASKFAVRGMTRAAALELGPLGIRVNVIIPGPIATPMLPPHFVDEAPVPLGRVAQPVEVAKLVLFLASDDSSYSTGADFVIDGGMTSQVSPIPKGYFDSNRA